MDIEGLVRASSEDGVNDLRGAGRKAGGRADRERERDKKESKVCRTGFGNAADVGGWKRV